MTQDKKTAGKRKAEPTPSEAEMAACSYLITAKPTRQERRIAVRLLLRLASKGLERGA